MILETRTRLMPVTALQWGPKWEDMEEVGKFLGANGFMFDIKLADERRGIDVMPELEVYDWRFVKHTVTFGLWIMVYPGTRQVRVVDKGTVDFELQVLADEKAEEGA
jgi:hypothetical protein